MSGATTPQITCIIPNYRTETLTRFCLRSLRKHSDPARIKVIVIDNDSKDGSTEYLRTVKGITLIERPAVAGETGPDMHSNSLDEAFKLVDTPYFLLMHTDTIVISDRWLDFLLGQIGQNDNIAGVGSWKLEYVSPLKRFGKSVETIVRRMLGKKIKDETAYLRSHCALYRTDMVRAVATGFNDGGTAGHKLHDALVAAGHTMVFIEPQKLMKHILHLNHATMILNPTQNSRRTKKRSAQKRIDRNLDTQYCRELLNDRSLDRWQAADENSTGDL